MDCHLIPVEVGVEGRADEGMDLDRLALDQDRLKGLDSESVERRRAVEQHRMVLDHLLKDIPDVVVLLLDLLLGLLDRRGVAFGLQAVVDEWLEEFQRHLLRQPALVKLQFRPDDDHRTARVVDPLPEEVLPEPSLLSFEGVRERLEGAVVDPAQHTAAPPVVEERVDRLLQHPLLVADDHLWRLQLDQL